MKSIAGILLVILYTSELISAQNTQTKKSEKAELVITESFTVYGNCGMCKNRIEIAAKKVKGVEKALWDSKSKILTVTYKNNLKDISIIHLAIAKVGHDTELVKAEDEVFDKLPACCRYQR